MMSMEALEAEKAAHAQTMQQLRSEEAVLKEVLAEQEGSFIALITRVTNLRVAKGEYMAARAMGTVKEEKFATGSAAVDRLLQVIQQKLQTPSGVSSTLLQQLSEAATNAVTPFCPNSINFQNESAVRTTGVAIITRSDVRSVRSWGRKHLKDCPQCAARAAGEVPKWEHYRYEDKRTGLAAATLAAGAPEKAGFYCSLQIVQDRSLRQRAVADDRRVDVLRSTTWLHVTGKNGEPLADPQAAADALSTFAAKWAERSLALVREKVAASAPWNVPETANTDLSAAVAMLLHAISPAVRVKVIPAEEVAAQYRHVQQQNPQKPSCLPPGASVFQLSLSVSVPVQVACLAPLIGLLGDPAQRRYLVDHLMTPLAAQLGSAVDMAELVSHYTAVSLNAMDAMHRMVEAHGLLDKSEEGTAPAQKPQQPQHQQQLAKRQTTTGKLYGICLAFAVFGTVVAVETAVPTQLATSATGGSMARAKVHALRLAMAFLRNLRAPSPFSVPLLNDPECADVVCRITDAPTTFLEILNRTFSSNERLPATSRKSMLDLVITPKTKLSLGLKLYSELCVELYRPLDLQRTAGLVLASHNGTHGRPHAPPCVPIADLPVDLVDANRAASAFTEKLQGRLEALEVEAQQETKLEQDGRRVLDKVADALGQSEPYQQWKQDLDGMHLAVKLVSQVAVEVLLPFGMTFTDPRESVEHLLYLHVNGKRTF